MRDPLFAMDHEGERPEGVTLAETSKLAADSELSPVLTMASYNTCYARYVHKGGKHGMFNNAYIAYIRGLSKWLGGDLSYAPIAAELYAKIVVPFGEYVLAPINRLTRSGKFCPLPDNPDEQVYFKKVVSFANEKELLATMARPNAPLP
jgi:hypothetical protein